MSFSGLDIAVSALRAQQYALNVTGHNIANANTEGYRRQEPIFVTNNPAQGSYALGGSIIPQFGTGVVIQTIRRAQTDYLDGLIRRATDQLGMWQSRNEALGQIESIFGEPGSMGLSGVLDQFWNSWEELASSPDSLPARSAVVDAGVALADRMRKLYGDLLSLQKHTDQTIADCVAQVNTLAQEIAKINNEITGVVSAGNSPNDLLDRRALLIEELSKFVRVEVHGLNGSELMLSIGGKNLVQGTHVNEISVVQGTGAWSDIVWSNDNTQVLINGGQIKGLLYVRDTTIQECIDSLNTIASGLIEAVNAIYSEGRLPNGNPAGNFFASGRNASNIEVEWALISDPRMVATGTSGTIADNSIALNISDLRNQPVIDGETIGDAYNSLIARTGANAREAKNQHSVQELSTHQLKLQRASMSGVSIDEEMVNMIKYQQAYNAAARIISVMDEMLDTIISQMGISGR